MFSPRELHSSMSVDRSDAEGSSNAIERVPAPERLDAEFLAFLNTHISSPSCPARLRQHIRAHEILNPFAPGDKLGNVNRFFLSQADVIRPWLAGDILLKDKLREYPAVYRRMWPGEVEPDTTRATDVKRKRGDQDVGGVEDGRTGGTEGEDGSPGFKATKRPRFHHAFEAQYDGSFDSPYDSVARSPEVPSVGVVRYTADHPAVEAIYREYTSTARPPLQAPEGQPPLTSPSNVRLRSAPTEEDDLCLRDDGDEEETYTPRSSPPASELDNRICPSPLHPPSSLSPSCTAVAQLPSHLLHTTSSSPPPFPELSPALLASWSTIHHPPTQPHHPHLPPDHTPAEVVDTDESRRGLTRLPRRGWEWSEDTQYAGTRQPPLGVRLEHALNFLREEDRDRCLGFGDKVREIEEWLDWLEDEAGGGYIRRAGWLVRGMVADVRRKIEVHRLFDGEKYRVVKPGSGIRRVENVPKPRRGARLGMVGDGGEGVGPGGVDGDEEEDHGERRVLVARPERVNTQFRPADGVEDEESGEVEFFLKRLNESERAFWAGESDERGDYLFRLENAAYEACSKPGGPRQTVKTEDGEGSLVLPAEEELPLPPADELVSAVDKRMRRHAVERGARRAALQGALRCFTATEQTIATTEWNRVVPPVENAVLEEVRRDLGRNYQWQPARMDAPVKLETMQFTAVWRLHRKLLADLGEHVRKEVNGRNRSTPGWVTVPKGATYGGPFVLPTVDPDVQEQYSSLRKEKPTRRKAAPPSRKLLADSLHTFIHFYKDIQGQYASTWDLNSAEPSLSLSKLVKDIDPGIWDRHIRLIAERTTPSDQLDPEDKEAAMEATALAVIRHKIIQENHENLAMLGRGREVVFERADGSIGAALARDHNWDWASVGVRGQARRFFSLDRWPLELQAEETRARVRWEENVDPR